MEWHVYVGAGLAVAVPVLLFVALPLWWYATRS